MLNALLFKTLVKQHKNRIYSYSYYLLKNRMDADDITQEVLIRIWRNLGKFKLSSAKPWIMKTTHNLCLDYLRRNNIELIRTIEIDEKFEESFSDKDKTIKPDNYTHNNLMNDKIKNAINNLPENLKFPFVLFELEGLKYKEISEVLEIPLNSVRVYILRARKKIQEELKEYSYEEVF